MNSRTRRPTLMLLAAALLTACANVTAPTSAPTSASLSATTRPTLPTSSPRSLPVSNAAHILMPGVVTVDRDYVDRYVCVTGRPLLCECYSRLSPVCQCLCQ
jgi:hypothetical protein